MAKKRKVMKSKRTKKGRSLAVINKSLNVVPDRQVRKLVYEDYIDLNNSVLTGSLQPFDTYGANCLFDPYIATGGHQPYGFDEYMAMYKSARVLKSKITVQWSPKTVVSNADCLGYFRVITSPQANIAFISGSGDPWQSFFEQPGGTKAVAFGNWDGSYFISPDRFSKASYNEAVQYRARDKDTNNSTSSNPTDITYYHIVAQSADPSGTVRYGTQQFRISIEYTVEFNEPKQLSTS